MSELILGMIGAILVVAAYKGGFYIGQKSVGPGEKKVVEIDEEERRQREKLAKDINTVFNYKGGVKR